MTYTPSTSSRAAPTPAPATLPAAADGAPASPAAAQGDLHGRVLDGRFVLQEQIGEGGHAVVWRARDRLMRTRVAVKILRDPDLERRQRFSLESEVLANLHHPNVVRAIARGVTDEAQPYVVLELVAGQSLRARLDADGPLPWREVIEIGIQVAAALTAVHSRGVIHRDVKPGNLMRTSDDGGGLVVQLIDFGVARLTEDWDPQADADTTPEAPRRRTDAGMAVGTPAYMPIEAGLCAPDERFDVYSLGVTLHELCTGALPGIDPLRPLAEVYPACDAPADLAVVLAAALALEPGDRTQTAAELGRALAAVRAAHPEHPPSSLFDGRYELLAVAGTGAKGEAFHAHHRAGGHDLVLKLLRSTHPDDMHRFRREARLLALLDHPCLPRFYDVGQVGDTPYIAMARAPGLPAARFCRLTDAGRLSPVEVAQVGLQLAEVLAHVHARGILHRDLNTNNVLIDLQRHPKVTLLDFGCAALTEAFYNSGAVRRYQTPPESRVVIPDGNIETLAWAAPEARAGQGFTDKSDVYSLGLLLFRLLTGKLPTSKGQDQPVSPRVYARACPNELATAILCALNPDPRQRPNAAQLAARLEEALAKDEALAEDEALAGRARAEHEAPAGRARAEHEAPPLPATPPALNLSPPVAPEPLAASTRGWTRFMAATAEPADASCIPKPSAEDSNAGTAKILSLQAISEHAPTSEPVPAQPAPAAPRPWRARAAGAAVLLSTAALLMWSMRHPATLPPADGAIAIQTDQTPAASHKPDQATAIHEAPALTTRTNPGVSLPAMRDALDLAAAPLRDCARQAGGALLLEFQTAEHRERFASTRVLGEGSPAVLRCIDEALAPVRFAPAPIQILTAEYSP